MKGLWKTAKRLHSDQRGAVGLETLLIIAAIVLPLLGALLYFKDEIISWASSSFDAIRGEAGDDPTYNP